MATLLGGTRWIDDDPYGDDYIPEDERELSPLDDDYCKYDENEEDNDL